MRPPEEHLAKAKRGGFILAGMLLCACVGIAARRDKPQAPPESELDKAPAAARDWPNPYVGQTDALLAGKKLFRRYCAECHGSEGKGEGKAPDLRSSRIHNVPPGVLFWFLKNGNLKEGMPSWSGLPDQQRWQLVTYLKSLK